MKAAKPRSFAWNTKVQPLANSGTAFAARSHGSSSSQGCQRSNRSSVQRKR